LVQIICRKIIPYIDYYLWYMGTNQSVVYFFFWAVLGFELRASCLLGRHSTTCFHYFSDRVSHVCLGPTSDCDPSTYNLLHSWDHGVTAPHPAYCFRSGLANICPGCPQTVILQISSSRVVEITGVSHCT
jgi:hypothetical protein